VRESAGILAFRQVSSQLQVFLVHPGGPFWAKKDEGAWSIPKGEIKEDEDPLLAARREFKEETGLDLEAEGEVIPLRPLRQAGGKIIHAWAIECQLDPTKFKSNTFSMEWPPKSGRHQEFPEIDKVGWFGIEEAKRKILKSQLPLLNELQEKIRGGIDQKPSFGG
jgi:predicted NUDIX family NTP pyrophosphohydrolase